MRRALPLPRVPFRGRKRLDNALCNAKRASESTRAPSPPLVPVRTRAAITADLAATPNDDPAFDRLREELKEHDDRREPFTKDGDIKPEWSQSMSSRNREVLECMIVMAGSNPDDDTASLLRSAATCFRGVPTGEVLRNVRTGHRKPRFWRCPWPVCPKTCGPDPGPGFTDLPRPAHYRDVIAPAVSALEEPRFWFVIPSIELPGVYSTKDLVQIAASYVSRQSKGTRLWSWMSRHDGRHHPSIVGKNWLGEASVALTMGGGVVAFSSIGDSSLGSQTPPQLAFPMVLAVGRGAKFHLDLMEQRWLRLRRKLDIGIPRLDVVEMPDFLFAWQFYFDWWARTWFDGKEPMELARLLLAWRRRHLSVHTPLGALRGQIGKRRKYARATRRANPDEWVVECYIQDLGETTAAGVRRRIEEWNRAITESR